VRFYKVFRNGQRELVSETDLNPHVHFELSRAAQATLRRDQDGKGENPRRGRSVTETARTGNAVKHFMPRGVARVF
jgi:hypothetical protein